jgi:hypothetical protein
MKGILPEITALVLLVGCGGRSSLLDENVIPADYAAAPAEAGSTGDVATDTPSTGLSLVPLTSDSTGELTPNRLSIAGGWYAYGDGWGVVGPPGVCETIGMFAAAQCSTITSPLPMNSPGAMPGMGFPQNPPGTFCLSGIAAQVIGNPPDYSNIYGIGMGVDLNHANIVKMVYDATAHGVVGFQFDITGLPAATGDEVRVELPTPETSADGFASWGTSLTSSLPGGGKSVRVLFSELGQLFSSGTPPAFNPARLLSIEFHVPSVASGATVVSDLCVSNLQAIVTD